MLPPMALVASGLQALVCSKVTGMRRSVDRKLLVRKSSARTIAFILYLKSSVLDQAQYLPQSDSSTSAGAGGILLEWQRAQFSAKTTLPRVSFSASSVRYALPPGASLRRSGVA